MAGHQEAPAHRKTTHQADTPPVVHGDTPEIDEVSFAPNDPPKEEVASLDYPDSFEHDIHAFDDIDVDGLDVDDIDIGGWDLDDYDPDARQSPWGVPPTDITRIAAGKAAEMVRLMPLARRTDQDAALWYLTDLFEHLPHPATYRALRGLAGNLGVEEIEAMVSLREVWLASDAWTGGFSWKLAYLICRARSEYTPDAMIDDDWFSEWRSPESQHRWFSKFVESRLKAQKTQKLNEALRVHASHEDPEEGFGSRRFAALVRTLMEE